MGAVTHEYRLHSHQNYSYYFLSLLPAGLLAQRPVNDPNRLNFPDFKSLGCRFVLNRLSDLFSLQILLQIRVDEVK